MPSYVAPSLTQTANGKDIYIPASSAGGGNVIPGNLQVVGDLSVGGTSILTGAVTATGALNVGGALTATGAVAGASVSATAGVSGNTLTATGAVSAGSVVSSGAISGASLAVTGASSAGSLAVVGATKLVPAPPGAGSAVTWATALETKGTKLIYSYSATLTNVDNIGVPSPYSGNVFNQAGVLTINLQSQGTAGDANGRLVQVQNTIFNVGSGAFTQLPNYVNNVTAGITGSAPAGYVLTAGGASYSGSCFVTWETIQP